MFAFLHAGDVDQGRPAIRLSVCEPPKFSDERDGERDDDDRVHQTRPDQTLIQNKPVCLGVAQGKL